MKVTILAHTMDPQEVVATAGRTCYSASTPTQIMNDIDDARIDVEHQLGVIHGSCFEHASFTFAIEGISRDCSHQLVRHRLASFSQQSQRYVKQADRDVVCPQSIIDSSDGAEYEFYKAIDGCFNAYERLLAIGVPKEDARYVLPGAVLTNIVTTMNARELMHFFSLRCCNRAQKEIRELANAMLAEVRVIAPKIFEKAGASCVQLGYCPEHKCCGKAPTLADLGEAWRHVRDAKVVAKLNGGDEE